MPVAIRALTRLQDADDANMTPGAGTDGYAITWNNATGKFVLSAMSYPVSSVFGRTGAVVAETGDYTAAQVTNAAATNAANTFTAGNIFTGGLVSYKNGISSNFIAGGAGNATMTGGDNVGIGDKALLRITSGDKNFALGQYALGDAATTSTNCVAIGAQTMRSATGSYAVAIGAGSLQSVTSWFCVGIGLGALNSCTSGEKNVVIGAYGLLPITTGKNNTAIGHEVGRGAAATVTGCVFIGYRAAFNETGSNLLYITNSDTATPLIYGNFATGLLKFHTVDAGTNTAPNTVSLVHNSSGTPDTNFGSSLRFGLQSSTTADQNAARIAGLWYEATHASMKADLVGYASDAAGEREGWRVRANGSAAAIGFLGATPIVRQSHIADASVDLADVVGKFNSLLAYLENFGFIATS